MKKRILSFILVCAIAIAPFISGCTEREGKDPSDKSVSKAEKERVTNVFKTNVVSMPENYNLSGDAVMMYNDRLYTTGYELLDEETYEMRNFIVSMDTSGENLEYEDMRTFEENQYMNSFKILSDGSRLYLISTYDQETGTQEYILLKEDVSGNEIFSINVENLFPDPSDDMFGGHFYINGFVFDAEERIYLQSSTAIVVLSPEGEKLFDVSFPSYVNKIVEIDGKIAVQYYDMDSMFKYIDAEQKKLGDDVVFPGNLSMNNMEIYSVRLTDDSGYAFYYKNDIGIYGVSDTGTDEIINWLNSDISPRSVSSVFILNKDKIFYRGYDYITSESISGFLTRIPDDEVVPKYVIELAYANNGGQWSLMNIAAKFNQQNENYRVKVIDYNELSGGLYGEDMTAFINTQIAAGNIPDMFLLDSYSMTGKEYADKGLFIDLYEYMDSDSEHTLTRDKFLKCALGPFETDGKLYKLATSFTISTVVGKTENVGSKANWSISDFIDMAQNMADGVSLTQYDSKASIFGMISKGLSEFIDYENGTCSFSGDTFVRLLDYIGTLPVEAEDNYNNEDPYKVYRENTTLLIQQYLWSFTDYTRLKIDFNTDELTFLGYPGSGQNLNVQTAYAISSKSEEEIRDGAWQFIKAVFESQSDSMAMRGRGDFPSTYEGFQIAAELEMKTYYLVRPNGGMSGSSWEPSEEEVNERGGVPMRVTQEDADEILAFLESITKVKEVNTKISEIISEEMGYFYEGAKTSRETADMIQSRVSIYLSETK